MCHRVFTVCYSIGGVLRTLASRIIFMAELPYSGFDAGDRMAIQKDEDLYTARPYYRDQHITT